MRNLFIDVSSYQEDSVEYFQRAKDKGVMGVVVKLTEGSEDGSAYVNPRAAAQIRNSLAVGLRVIRVMRMRRMKHDSSLRLLSSTV